MDTDQKLFKDYYTIANAHCLPFSYNYWMIAPKHPNAAKPVPSRLHRTEAAVIDHFYKHISRML